MGLPSHSWAWPGGHLSLGHCPRPYVEAEARPQVCEGRKPHPSLAPGSPLQATDGHWQ